LKPLFLYLYLLLLPPIAHAASFDCAKAASPTEKAICSDPHLSALDGQLSIAYQIALRSAGEGDIVVRHQQRAWLSGLNEQCTGSQINTCIERHQTARIHALSNTPPFDSSRVTEYKLSQSSRSFDFVIRMFPIIQGPDDTTREGPGRVLVFVKGSATPLQTITMDNIFASLGKGGQPLTNTAKLYDYQGLINVGDFNFDGHEDFAIQNGNNGAYGGPSYNVYLYSPSTERFQLSQSMTDLIASTLGFFDVDTKKKLLTTLSKDGCCFHTTTAYTVVHDDPIPVSREIEDATKSDKYVLVTTQLMINGKWQGKSKRVPQDKTP
jgi:uncharacterized protein YecT (DUF1311 family)